MTVSASDVAEALGSTKLSDPELQSFIGASGRLYDNLTSNDNVASDVRDDVVTRLAAHLVATGPERQIASGGEGGGNIQFEGATEMGLDATTHGQMAQMFDPTAKLSGTDKPAATVNVPDAKGID